MIARKPSFFTLLLLSGGPLLLLGSCGQDDSEAVSVVQDIDDPLMDVALSEQILVDPDMKNRNTANQAIALGPQDGAIPMVDRGAGAARAARDEALELVGGINAMRRAPQPERVDGKLPEGARLSVAARAASAGEGKRDCASIAEFSALWAARMPEAFPVYPRGAVQEAAGTDRGGCHLRVVNFLTPVALGDVRDFYFTRGSTNGFAMQRVLQDGEDVLGGTAEGRSFMVFARSGDDGMTSVDLVTTGN